MAISASVSGVGIGIHRAIAIHQDLVGKAHEKDRGDDLCTWLCLDDLQSWTNRIGSRVTAPETKPSTSACASTTVLEPDIVLEQLGCVVRGESPCLRISTSGPMQFARSSEGSRISRFFGSSTSRPCSDLISLDFRGGHSGQYFAARRAPPREVSVAHHLPGRTIRFSAARARSVTR